MLLYYFNNANLEGVRSHIDIRVNRMVKTQKVRLVGGEPPDVSLVKKAASPLTQKRDACTMLNPHTHTIATTLLGKHHLGKVSLPGTYLTNPLVK